jgi:hypothetical protein
MLDTSIAQLGKAAVVRQRRSAITGADGVNRDGALAIMI